MIILVVSRIIKKINLMDSQQSWSMNSDGSYKRLDLKKDKFSAHTYFITNPSLS